MAEGVVNNRVVSDAIRVTDLSDRADVDVTMLIEHYKVRVERILSNVDDPELREKILSRFDRLIKDLEEPEHDD